MLDSNLGVAVLPEYFTGRFSGSSNIRSRLIDEPLEPTDFYAVWKPGKQSKELSQLVTYMKEYYK